MLKSTKKRKQKKLLEEKLEKQQNRPLLRILNLVQGKNMFLEEGSSSRIHNLTLSMMIKTTLIHKLVDTKIPVISPTWTPEET
jgi:NADH:ubiquinone oxidoreductase subunit E